MRWSFCAAALAGIVLANYASQSTQIPANVLESGAGDMPIAFGVHSRGCVVALQTRLKDKDSYKCSERLVFSKLDTGKVIADISFQSDWRYEPRWRLESDWLWIVSVEWMLHPSQPTACIGTTSVATLLKNAKSADIALYSGWVFLDELLTDLRYRHPGEEDRYSFHYDLHFVGNDCIVCVHHYKKYLDGFRKYLEEHGNQPKKCERQEKALEKEDDMEIAVYRARGKREKTGLHLEDWREVDRIVCPFNSRERFWAFLVKDTYYFILATADGGKVYMAKKPEKEKEKRKLEPLWTDAKKPITAIIDDQDQGKVFLFGKNKHARINAKDFYFELAEKPDPQEFDISDLKELKADEPVKTLWQYATLLSERRKEKK
jgi:hypothetical protein